MSNWGSVEPTDWWRRIPAGPVVVRYSQRGTGCTGCTFCS